MDILELEEALSEILPFGFKIETDKRGQLIILTHLSQDDDGELHDFESDEDEDDPDFDPDFQSLEDDDEED